MDRKLIDYLPPVLREVADFKAINAANEPEIVLAWDALNRVMDNQFLDSADENGVQVWERELEIRPKDTDSLELRKMRIRAMWGMQPPYTLPWLRKWITGLCGEQGHQEWTDQYQIHIQLDYSVLENGNALRREITALLLKVRPANMLMEVASHLETDGAVTYSACSEMTGRMEVWPMLVTEMENTGEVAVGGVQVYRTKMEIYPMGGMANG